MHLTLLRALRDRSAIAATEFAMTLPLIVMVGASGVELSNLALTNLRLSQIALSLADNASRVGLRSQNQMQQLREADINDVLFGAQTQGSSLGLTRNGRITVSQLQQNAQGGQWIVWQRCLGVRNDASFRSSYGAEGDGATGTSLTGMGPANAQVTAPPGSAVIFVELNYQYAPVWTFGVDTTRRINYVASFIVRDRRELSAPTNPQPAATRMTCDRYTATVPTRS